MFNTNSQKIDRKMKSEERRLAAMEKSGCRVCVTGGAGYIGSSLVQKLLQKGYTVHATLRNLEDRAKAGLLQSLPDADTRLKLFKADIYSPEEFEQAIQGCEFVFHVATPLQHTEGSKYKDRAEAAVAGVRSIAEACIKSATVKRLIYTASPVSASPLKDDGSGLKDSIDETCWTPHHLSFCFCNSFLEGYSYSKTVAEREILRYGEDKNSGLEVVSLVCGLVGGETLLPYTPESVGMFISQLTENENRYRTLRFLEELLGKVPIIHIDDVCEAHIFCTLKPSINGRFLCASSWISSAEITNYYRQHYPQLPLKPEYLEMLPKREIKWGSTKLIEEGFEYKYDRDAILEACVTCGRKTGDLP